MNERINDSQLEKLSAFLDGELSEQEQDALVTQLASDSALRSKLARFHSVSAHLQADDLPRVDASSIAAAVSASIHDEPTVLAPRKKRSSFKMQRLALGTALAATVAAVAVSVAPQLLDPGSEALPPETFAFAPRLSVPTVDATTVALGGWAPSAQARETDNNQQRWKLLKPDVQNKLDTYLLEHNEFAGRLSVTQPNVHVGFVSGNNAQR
jgi:sigma-E factor negative regulatory protein RseA